MQPNEHRIKRFFIGPLKDRRHLDAKERLIAFFTGIFQNKPESSLTRIIREALAWLFRMRFGSKGSNWPLMWISMGYLPFKGRMPSLRIRVDPGVT